MSLSLLKDEKIVKVGKANRVRLFGSQSGELFLTNKRLVFKAFDFNFKKDILSIQLSDVSRFKAAYTFTLNLIIPISNAIKVDTRNKLVYTFTVFDKKDWIKALESLKQ